MTDAPVNTSDSNQPVTIADNTLPALPDLNTPATPVTPVVPTLEPVEIETPTMPLNTDVELPKFMQEQPTNPVMPEPPMPPSNPLEAIAESLPSIPTPEPVVSNAEATQAPEQSITPESTTKQPLIIKASKLSNVALRTFIMEYLKGNNNDYKDTLEQIQTIDELIEKDELTEEELINNPIGL